MGWDFALAKFYFAGDGMGKLKSLSPQSPKSPNVGSRAWSWPMRRRWVRTRALGKAPRSNSAGISFLPRYFLNAFRQILGCRAMEDGAMKFE
jgi:hypothetical protein